MHQSKGKDNNMIYSSGLNPRSLLLFFILGGSHVESIDYGTDFDSLSEVELFDPTQLPTLLKTNEYDSGIGGIETDEYLRRQFDKRENDEIVEAKIPVLEFADGPFVRVFGRAVNYTETTSFGDDILTVLEFKALPYAEAPVKSLRFQRPILKAKRLKILKVPQNGFRALQKGMPCPQTSASGDVFGDEDCLHLSIYIPHSDQENRGKLPMLVWFHGESMHKLASGILSMFSSGSAQEVEPNVFLQNNVIVVTPQYRLGSFGFLSVANEDLNGNMGLLDQLLALEWIKKYISFFGGDPSQITVMGQGSSATSLGLLATSGEMARGYFHRMILMSGSPLMPFALDTNQKLTFTEIAQQNSCPTFPTLQFVRCMQKKDMTSITLADRNLIKDKHLGKFRSPLPVIQKEDDMRFLQPLIYTTPEIKLKEGLFQDVPIIIGVTRSEMYGFLSSVTGKPDSFLSTLFSGTGVLRQFIRAILSRSKFPLDSDVTAKLATFEYFSGLNISERQEQAKDLLEEIISDYLYYVPALLLAKMWSQYAPVYMYVFDYVASEENVEDDREFMRNERQTEQGPSPTITQAIHGSDLQFLMGGFKKSAQDREVANVLTESFINFIYKGSPLHSGVNWPQYREDTKEYLHFSETIQVRSKFRARQEQFWTQLLNELSEKQGLSTSTCQNSKNRRL